MEGGSAKEALEALVDVIGRHSGRIVGEEVERVFSEQRLDPRQDAWDLASWIWTTVAEQDPLAFGGRNREQHSEVALSVLYALASAPESIRPLKLSRSGQRSLRAVRAEIASLAGLPTLTKRRCRHLLADERSAPALTLDAIAPEAGGVALAYQPFLKQTAVYAPGWLELPETEIAEVIGMFIHEELHLTLERRVKALPPRTTLERAACEFASDSAQMIAELLVRESEVDLDAVSELLHRYERPSAAVFDRLPRKDGVSGVLRAMVSLTAASDRGSDVLDEAVQTVIPGSTVADLAHWLGLD